MKKIYFLASLLLLVIILFSAYQLYDKKQDVFNIQLTKPQGGKNLLFLDSVKFGKALIIQKNNTPPRKGYKIELKKNEANIYEEWETIEDSDKIFQKVTFNITVPAVQNTRLEVKNSETEKIFEISSDELEKRSGADLKKSKFAKLKDKITTLFQKLTRDRKQEEKPARLEELTQDITEPKILAANSEMIIWYYPQNGTFLVKMLKNDPGGIKNRALDWFKGLGVKNPNTLNIDFAEVAGTQIDPQTGKVVK